MSEQDFARDVAGSNDNGLTSRIEELTTKIKEESKNEDAARWAKADEERATLSAELAKISDEQRQKERDEKTAKAVAEMQDFLASVRRPPWSP